MKKYVGINEGTRDKAIRVGLEEQLYYFFVDYAQEMGISRSAALRRLALIGAKCEAEHGNQPMPAAYDTILQLERKRRKKIRQLSAMNESLGAYYGDDIGSFPAPKKKEE